MEQELFTLALGVKDPVFVESVDFNAKDGELHIYLNFTKGGLFSCSACKSQEDFPVYDTKDKVWRHLNFFQYKCYLHFRTPRVKCSHCKSPKLWSPPWAKEGSGFTLLFEAFVLQLAKVMPILDVANIIGEKDTRIWRIVEKWVRLSHNQKQFTNVSKIGVDETSSKKGHNYVTIFADVTSSDVLYATVGKDASTVESFVKQLPKHGWAAEEVKEVTMDMSPAFISGVSLYLPNASITHDRFHVMKLLNEAVDKVRRDEQSTRPQLKKTRYVWLKNERNLKTSQLKILDSLSRTNLKTARAYQWKLNFQEIYQTSSTLQVAQMKMQRWLKGVMYSRLEPLKVFAKIVKRHYDGIMRYFTSRITSGFIESINSRIQEVKRRAKGYRNMDNFITMIYLVCSKLSLPTIRNITHTI